MTKKVTKNLQALLCQSKTLILRTCTTVFCDWIKRGFDCEAFMYDVLMIPKIISLLYTCVLLRGRYRYIQHDILSCLLEVFVTFDPILRQKSEECQSLSQNQRGVWVAHSVRFLILITPDRPSRGKLKIHLPFIALFPDVRKNIRTRQNRKQHIPSPPCCDV